MNSFNHYGLGSIGDWLYDEVGGLAPAEPGYKKLLVAAVHGRAEQRVVRREDRLRPARGPPGRGTPPAA